VAQGAANPYAVTIVPNGDPSLDLSNAQLSTTLARRLCIPQLTHPSLSDAAEQTNVCPTCQQRHANGHLDQALVCYSCGNSGRTRWHNNVQHEVGAFINSVGHHSRLEPPGVDPDSGKRADGECNSLLRGGNSVYWDVNTYAVTTGTDADAREAAFPGLAADKHEYAKTRKHAAAIFANRQGDEFVPLVVSDAGSWGPQAMAFFSRLARTTEAPARTLQYRLRRLAVVTAKGVHDIMHGGVRLSLRGGGAGPRPGHAPPGAVWEADDESDDDEGDDAMTSEQLRRAEEELLEGVVRGDDDGGRDGVADGTLDGGGEGAGGGETDQGPQINVLA
jgi:hypothetical protein